MRISIGIALVAAALMSGSLARADGPPAPPAGPGFGSVRPGPYPARDSHLRHHRHHHRGAYRAFIGPAGPSYGPEPVYYPGAGGASPNAGFGALSPVPVAVTLYREAYIGRGLVYNTPPEPHWPSREVISVRY